ncbi:helix-turn-helix transcriptional regulator [Streptomyces syringium]|uniref:helix-turn-helix transcriptional regulator n=1 Tax=Streptomyces syringium TaxID=76729 RepID=UPI003AB01B0E
MPSSSAPPPGLLYIEDTKEGPGIASRLGITPSTYRKWRMKKKGPHTFRLSKRVVARIEAVDAYIAQQEQAAKQPRPEMRPPELRGARLPAQRAA